MAISTLRNVMYPFSCPSAKPASPCSTQGSSSSRNLPPIVAFAVAQNCDTFFIPTTTLSYCLRLTRIRTFLLPLPFTPDLEIESFGIFTPSSCTTSSRGTRLICVFLMILREEIIREMLRNASKRTQMEPSCTIIRHIYKPPTLSDTRPVSFDPPASSSASSPSFITKDHDLVFVKISLSAQTRQTRIVEGTLPATPSTTLRPAPQANFTTMSTRQNPGKGRSVWIDEDMQVVVKGDGGHGVDGDSEELSSEDKDGTMQHATRLPTPTRKAGALRQALHRHCVIFTDEEAAAGEKGSVGGLKYKGL
ncbi:hypothetical protein BKA70DRAFT_1433983 [Coprinopsis sp. MPI-PUGE-AT-0042]|nr:hypothetical protein BKA70DRAFT_1433983 [Coprinopsis sp. MPI-PUGE-AT-0042]